MADKGIVPVKLSLTEGDFYTLFAPKWREHGAEWQAFLGFGDDLYVFQTPAELLLFLESGDKHDLQFIISTNHKNLSCLADDSAIGARLEITVQPGFADRVRTKD